ncbi:hypothetical protein CDAR_200831 [Caerostris darwini]|uniref:Uncharacterized protein n=1 Tax=Caerostris darwini TaxID=1538125 RepID=A0AAV4Q7Z1_9ARAC|nr:hypothetical protein CDAR_200831 [Caerostris darwini]
MSWIKEFSKRLHLSDFEFNSTSSEVFPFGLRRKLHRLTSFIPKSGLRRDVGRNGNRIMLMKKTPTSDKSNSEIWTATGRKSHSCVYIPFPKEVSSNVRSTQAAHVRGIWLLPSAIFPHTKNSSGDSEVIRKVREKFPIGYGTNT